MDRKRIEAFQRVAQKSHRVLTLVLAFICILALRIAYLSLYERDAKAQEAKKGRQRVEIISAPRGTIRDRFQVTLAANQIDYRVSIVWSEISEIPRRIPLSLPSPSHANASGKWRYLRREYVKALAKMLEKSLSGLSAQRIEDVIYSYAVYSHSAPVVIASGLSEKQFYELGLKAKDWPGLRVEMGSKRVYPRGRSLCHIVGYTAPIQREEYEAVLQERRRLIQAIQRRENGIDDVYSEEPDPLDSEDYIVLKHRLSVVERKLYAMNDSVGRSGIEATYEHALRGLHGKRMYETNARGDILKESSGSKDAIPGKRVVLTISADLQKKCEELLAQSELDRRKWLLSETERVKHGAMDPFVRGGAIVALDAKSGDVLALASFPRFDPNDFVVDTTSSLTKSPIQKLSFVNNRVRRKHWLQTEDWLSAVWEGQTPLIRETWDETLQTMKEEATPLSWRQFLSLVIPAGSSLHELLHPKTLACEHYERQKTFLTLLKHTHLTPQELGTKLKDRDYVSLVQWSAIPERTQKEFLGRCEKLSAYFRSTATINEALVGLDMSRLILRHEDCPKTLVPLLRQWSISELRECTQGILVASQLLKEILFVAFEEGPFKEWRKEKETSFLKECREKEALEKKVNKPFVIYIDRECARQFDEWWKEHHSDALLFFYQKELKSQENADDFSKDMLSNSQWAKDAITQLKKVVTKNNSSQEMTKIEDSLFSYTRAVLSRCEKMFSPLPYDLKRDLVSIAKPLHSLNEISLLAKYNSIRRFGRPKAISHLVAALYSTTSPPVQSLAYMLSSPPGSIFKLVTSYSLLKEQERRLEKNGLSTKHLSPGFYTLKDQVFKVGNKTYVGIFPTGEAIPQIYKGGRIPKSLSSSIGDVDLLRAIEYSSNPFFSLAASEYLSSPSQLMESAQMFGFGERTGIHLPSEATGYVPKDIIANKTALYTTAIGQHTLLATPLQAATMLGAYANRGDIIIPKIISMVVGTSPKEEVLSSSLKDSELPYARTLRSIGIDFPIWVKSVPEQTRQRIWVMQKKIKRRIPLDQDIQKLVFRGMKHVTERMTSDRKVFNHILGHRSDLLAALRRQKNYMIAKTSTAESFESIGVSYGQKPFMYSHTGIGAIFSRSPFLLDQSQMVHIAPDIIVVVMLRYGSFGKEAGPIAARIVETWRSLCQSRRSKEPPLN